MPKYPFVQLPFKFSANVARWVEREDSSDMCYIEARIKVSKDDLKTLRVEDWDNLIITIEKKNAIKRA
jgi:hypothetical protein